MVILASKYTVMQLLPPKIDKVETPAILKKLASAHRYLAEMKGVASAIPNPSILIDTLSLREARESSAIENIITTYDEVYQSSVANQHYASPAAKEVHSYSQALKFGFDLVRVTGLLTNKHILQIQETIENNNAGYRKLPGTKLLNSNTGEVVCTPPQEYDEIVSLMYNLEEFINGENILAVDPLIKMAIIHHQFESIHPFYDGNGRTGRIINILYLIHQQLLDIPILYLSRYIIRHKEKYYRLLQEVRDTGSWEEWILYILDAVELTAADTITLIQQIREMMQQHKSNIRTKLPKIYSQDLLNNLFRYPYTKIDFVAKDLKVSRNTAIKYLDALNAIGILEKRKIGRENFYINQPLFRLLSEG